MKVVGLVSGGKDSCYAMMKCIEYGHEIVALANLMPVDDSLDELDSHMYQTVGHQIAVSYAECMGLPLFRRRIQGSTRHQSLSYRTTPGDEVEDMFILLDEVKQQIPSISAVSTGAIASDYQRLRVESVCSRLGLVSLSYLWKQDQSLLLQEMISKGVVAVIVKVAALGLKPAVHLGSELAQLQPLLLQLNEKYGINVCGEGGEYETLTLDCPLFTNARIVLDDFQVILHSPDSIASVGILHPLAFHLEHKNGCKSEGSTSTDSASKMVGFVHEVQGANVLKYGDKCMSTTETHLANGISTLKEVHISKTNGDTFSIGCWIQDSGNSGNCDLESGLAAVLQRIESELVEGGYCWADVLYIHLYIADMNSFALANETYVRFITEKKCHLGVPSRSTIELPLLQVGLGEAFVEVLVTNEKSKKVLHVQSVSCWAPSCIGPYSQATLYKGVLYMAGQLGLDPPTMMLCSGGAAAEMEQALKNCEAVASCYNCSLPGSSILLVVYCASSLDASERPEIQKKMENIVGKRSNQSLQHGNVNNMHEPVYLYVLAPNLPKGGLVEVKPICYVPDNEETTIQTALQNPTCTDVLNLWGFQQSDWHGSCCQEYVIPGKICSAVLSITEETAARVSSQTDQCSSNVQFLNDKKHLKSVVRFCIYLLDEILGKNDFSWVDLMNLRIYFTTSLCLSANGLSAAFVEAYDEFARLSQRIEMVKEPIFNLMPVIGSGRDTTFRDLITCELFASKL